MRNTESQKQDVPARDVMSGSDLWTDGLICAFEFIRAQTKSINSRYGSKVPSRQVESEYLKVQTPTNGLTEASSPRLDGNNLVTSSSLDDMMDSTTAFYEQKDGQNLHAAGLQALERYDGSRWKPIGWARISELAQTVQSDAGWELQQRELMDSEEDFTIADLATPYWERPAGPIWWCHVDACNPSIQTWLSNAHWLHPAISLALRNENRLISERMKHLLYEVPVRVAGGLLFELLGQSAGDPSVGMDDIPVVIRSWHAQNFLITALHIKGNVSRLNVLGITEVQELLAAGGFNIPRTVHEVIAHLASRLTRWDDRLFRKSIFGAADEIELKFMNRRNIEDMNLFSIVLNQEIPNLSMQVIRVKWSLHAREEIVFELMQHLRGNAAKHLLDGIRRSTREMITEQEAVRGRLFTIQDVMQSNIRAWLQDRSLRVTHNISVFGGCGLVLTIITGLFGINIDGIPGGQNTPYAFGLFSAILFLIGVLLVAVGLLYLGLKKPIDEKHVEVRKLKRELRELVKRFKHEAETHAQFSMKKLSPTARDVVNPDDADYVLIN